MTQLMGFPHPSIPQIDPPRPPKETLPTMYDLPSEDSEEPGLPDEFHDLQPQLLSATLRLRHISTDQSFTGTDLNLYYDVRHPLWHKRPDWFLVVGVPRLYEGKDLRSSYVIWQEGIAPFVVVELLSPGTLKEDLGPYAEPEAIATSPSTSSTDKGEGDRKTLLTNGQINNDTPPRKWDVYEQILRVPYYIVFSRYTSQLRFFQQVGGHYQEQPLNPDNPRIWIPELDLGIGIWDGEFAGVPHSWLRWCDAKGNWIPTAEERAERLAERLRQLGIDPDQV